MCDDMDTLNDRNQIPLVVDLDGTVIATDLFWEALVAAVKQNVFVLFLVPFWLLKIGRAHV